MSVWLLAVWLGLTPAHAQDLFYGCWIISLKHLGSSLSLESVMGYFNSLFLHRDIRVIRPEARCRNQIHPWKK